VRRRAPPCPSGRALSILSGEAIPDERLEAIPTAELMVEEEGAQRSA
jgi:hypothetical protein